MAVDFKAIANKRIAGVPVLYLGLAGVTVLAVVAWKMKPSPEATTVPEIDEAEGAAEKLDGADYSGLASGGTVTVVQSPVQPQEAEEETNDDWERTAVAFLVEQKKATASAAQSAISKYLDGADLTFDEGALKDAAVAKLGLPPERLSTVGVIGTQPAQKQFSLFPGRHTVKNSNDNTPAKLAQLYYGNADANHVNLIVSKNTQFGPVTTTYTTGTTLTIPGWQNPTYFTSNKTENWPKEVAAKAGISYQQLLALNPTLVPAQELKVGTRLRVG